MRNCVVLMLVVLFSIGILGVGCEKKESSKESEVKVPSAPSVTAAVVLCAKCGEVAGTPKCCAAEAKKCDKCSLIAGSPACCKGVDFTKGNVNLCPKCGEVAGSDKCCKAGAEKCTGCGMTKGSPGCCLAK